MFLSLDLGRNGFHICTRRWDITLASRKGADGIVQCWDAGAVSYDRWELNERSLRLPFVGIIWAPRN